MKSKFKKLWFILCVAVMAMVLLAGCKGKGDNTGDTEKQAQSGSVEAKTKGESESLSDNADAVGTKGENQYTQAFSIEYLENGIKRVIDGENRELILVPKNIEVPEAYKNANVIRTPIDKVLFMSSTQVCMLRPLDSETAWKSVAAVNGARDTWTIDEVLKGFDSGQIQNVGGGMGEPDYELIQKINPEIAFVYTGSSPQTGVIDKLTELGIPYAVDNEYMEQSYMARMEWLRFIAAFYNEDEKIDKVMAEATENIEAMKAAVAGRERPKVAYGNVYDGTVYVAAKDSWVANMIEDAGGEYVFNGVDVNATQLSLEEFFVKTKDADILIYSSTPDYAPDIASVTDQAPVLKACKPIQEGNVWQLSPSFWISTDESDQVAVDIAAMLYPDAFMDREITHFVKMK